MRSPRKLKKTSSGPAHIAKASKVALSLGNHSALADTSPIRRSEWPERYFVPASTAISAPRAWGGKNKGVAQVLSRIVQMPLDRASAAIAGTSWISKLCEPGISMKITLVFGRSGFDRRADRGIVIGCLDPHAGEDRLAEVARRTIDRVGHENMIARFDGG